MRMIGGFVLGGALLGALAGVVAHFTSYTAREGVFITEDGGDLLVRPPWAALFGWLVIGVIVGLLIGVILRAAGYRLVRVGRRPHEEREGSHE